MADIFISYAQKAPEPTQTLAADLARLKYSVWFDQRLLPMEKFGQAINRELDNAKAVITIWSEPALKSDWVYAEAIRANDTKKLINVHTPEVQPGALPVPFNIAQVALVTERTKIYEALGKLGVHPGGVAAPVEKEAREASEAALAFSLIKDSHDIADFEEFLAEFREEGRQFYIGLAERRLAVLRGSRLVAPPGVVAKPAEVPLPQAGDVFLRIEPGMHTAMIRRIGVDAACTLMATGSDDKTARLWTLPEGGRGEAKLKRTVRVPIGQGNDGKVNAVALSPDGQWVAAGGWDASWSTDNTMSVYIFEAATGRLVTRLGRLGNVINHLAFSPDGSRLAAALGGGEGMRLWEAGSWRLIAEDKDYGGKASNGAAFDGANRLFTVAYDRQIRRYGADGRLGAKAKAAGGAGPYSVAVHPKGGKLAVGFYDTTAVEVYDAASLKRLYAANTDGIFGGDLSKVAWSADGARLYAGGRHQSANGGLPVMIWQDEGRSKRAEAPLAQNAIMQLLPCGAGIAAGAADPAFGLIAVDGGKRVWQEGVTADIRDQREMFGLSVDGKKARFTLKWRSDPVLFDLAAFRLADAPQMPAGFAPPKTSGLAVSDWEDNTAPKLNGKPIALQDAYETAFSLAIAPDKSRFILGTHYWLRAYRADGGELWQKPVPGIAYGVNIAGNGKLAVAAYDDGTIRWHRLADGQELLALFVHAKDRRYIAWTPQGYYAASPGGEDLIGWHVNRGFDTAPDFYPASTFASTYCRPDIVKAALDNVDAPAPEPKAGGLFDKVRKWL